ncbi:hypothetical protein M703_05445 [Neisseria gonorrhoeae SK29344]|nr:hypothetical protein M685_06200 [Neisseria gonorrhoeae SK16259]KLS10198.1 hypothetical protein M716_11585 [Neisseria gonorrhoeae SK32402]KLS10940.1 hypothetical protein M703_05445 [Neisseria gonorrhoeae SK29344]KLS23236.1 hypothetical protein M733_09160 [Neisseria gonorrhoeae ATL_2011_05-13]KLS36821.1 hypothetical protein M724_06010 [Neisseria gonorrhoeae ATL_2011_01_05]KLS57496.1 hypothetical protein M742_06910 [Neisseria gonorrhoeae NYC_2011_05_07]KLS91546.1 hypothetical protein M775_093
MLKKKQIRLLILSDSFRRCHVFICPDNRCAV